MTTSWPVALPVPAPARPPHVDTAWGVRAFRDEDGLYDGLSYGAIVDRCERWREAGWRTDEHGRPVLPSDDRYALLWQHADGSWSAGHLGAGAPPTALAEHVSLTVARARAQGWARQHVRTSARQRTGATT